MKRTSDLPEEPSGDLSFFAVCNLPQKGEKRRRKARVKPPAPGDLCLQCHVGRLDYDGLLHLTCALCGYTLADGAGCT
jgi:hypothetical protein